MGFTEKQTEFFYNATHRWNIKSGATRSGKTYMDYFVIPKRIRAVSDKVGLNIILGNTKGTLQRNIIEPLQGIWGTKYVSDIRSDNTAIMFGEKVYCLGADKANQVNRLRGSSIKYCYGDEVVTWHEDVFNMLKSRLDKEYSKFDGTCNPESPKHWFKKFIEDAPKKGIDLYYQKYKLDDNTFLPEIVIENIKKEYTGTVLYDRYVLGEWAVAEGLIYQMFADNPKSFIIDQKPNDIMFITIGIDYGASRSCTSFKATAFSHGLKKVYSLAENDIEGIKTPEQLYRAFELFYHKVTTDFGHCYKAYADYGALGQVLTAGLRYYCANNGITIQIDDCSKGKIIDRIHLTSRLMASGRYKIHKDCKKLIEAFETAVWDEKEMDERLDDGTTDIDSLDAFEYSVYPFASKLITNMIMR